MMNETGEKEKEERVRGKSKREEVKSGECVISDVLVFLSIV